ncbi:MAG: Lrp/AsnC family transcriptional regulator [Promethearchaeota archaeon]
MEKIDDLDKEIIGILESDSRVSYRDISKKLRISVGTVHNRIKKMESRKILKGFLLNLDAEKLGYVLRFLILLSIDGRYIKEVLETIRTHPHITAVYQITGDFSAVIIGRFKVLEEFHMLLNKLNKIPHISKTTPNMILNIYKQDEHHIYSSLEEAIKQDSLELDEKSTEIWQNEFRKYKELK